MGSCILAAVAGLVLTLGGERPALAHGEGEAAEVTLDWPRITFGGGVPVGGSASVKLWGDGSYQFNGHLHDSGATSYNASVVFVLKTETGRVYTFAHTGRMAGTFESGSRDTDWNDTGFNEDLRAHWNEWSNYSWRASARADLDLGAIFRGFSDLIGTATTVIAVVGPLL